jgi:hypothetical protein
MKEVRSSETLVTTYKTTRCHNPEDITALRTSNLNTIARVILLGVCTPQYRLVTAWVHATGRHGRYSPKKKSALRYLQRDGTAGIHRSKNILFCGTCNGTARQVFTDQKTFCSAVPATGRHGRYSPIKKHSALLYLHHRYTYILFTLCVEQRNAILYAVFSSAFAQRFVQTFLP